MSNREIVSFRVVRDVSCVRGEARREISAIGFRVLRTDRRGLLFKCQTVFAE